MQTKRILTSLATAILVMSTMLPTLAAHAATNGNGSTSVQQALSTLQQAGAAALQNAANQAKGLVNAALSGTNVKYQKSAIVVNGRPSSTPYRITFDNTTYMPIYYVDTVLTSLGFTAKWNGSVHTWTLSNGQAAPSLSIDGKTGNTTITVNGATVEKNVSILQAKDPASGVVTTFMPIWYVQQILNHMGFATDTWNGSLSTPTWTLGTTAVTPPAPPTVTTSNDPTAAQVSQALLTFYSTQKVWPYHFGYFDEINVIQTNPTFIGTPPKGTQWDTNVNDWVGLKTVFPGQPAASWAKDLGMTNASANKPITAGTLAQWILNWEQDARAVKLVFNGKHMYPTSSAFGLLQLYSTFYGTNITNPTMMINQHDLQQVIKNLTDVGNGYRLLAPNKMELLLPLWGISGGIPPFSRPYPQWWADGVREVDSVTFTFNKNGSVTYDRAQYAGMVMLHSFVFMRNGQDSFVNYQNQMAFPQQQVSGKVPLTVIPYPLKNFGKWITGPNSLNIGWEPFGGTYFYARFTGPANLTTISNDNSTPNGIENVNVGVPAYFIQIENGNIKNVLYANEMNSYPFQVISHA